MGPNLGTSFGSCIVLYGFETKGAKSENQNRFTHSEHCLEKNGTKHKQKQVKLFFVWVAYLASIGYSMEEAVYINMDETPIPYHFGGKKGLKKHEDQNKGTDEMRDKTHLHNARQHCTLMAAICTDPNIQKALPQVLLPNVKGRKKKWDQVIKDKTECPNVKVKTGTGGWVDNKCLLEYFDILRDSLQEFKGKKVVIVMDSHSSHRSVPILKKLKNMKWKVLLVPGRMTSLLQPLDAYCFANFKRTLYKMHMKDRISTSDGQQSFESWAKVCFATMQHVFQNTNGKAMFQKCGYELPNACISNSILQHIASEHVGMIRKLTHAELSEYVGRESKKQHALLFHEPIPPAKREHCIVVRNPLHRRRSKFSVHHAA